MTTIDMASTEQVATTEQTSSTAPPMPRRTRKPTKKAKPTHYKVICISMYTSDIDDLDAKVRELKRRGRTKANKSELIRIALAQLDLDRAAELVR